MAGCCNMSARLVLMILALVFWACAAGLVYLTVHIFDYVDSFKHLYDVYYLTAPAGVLIGLSILLICVGFIGCLGACKESRCLQITFFVLLLIIVLMELTGAVLSIVYKDEVNMAIETGMNNAIEKYNDTDPNVQDSWDGMQETLKCCGVQSYEDWENTTWGKQHKNSVPESCCKASEIDNCTGQLPKDIDNINQEGCHKVLYKDVRDYLVWIIVVAIIFALIQIFGLICTCVRLWGRRKEQSPYEVLGTDGKPEPISRGYPA